MSLVGNLEDLGLGDIFQIIFLSRRSGILAVKGEAIGGKIYFKDGMVVAAYSLDASGRPVSTNAHDIVLSIFVEEGSFDFELKDPSDEIKKMETGLVVTVDAGLNPQFLAMEGARLLDEARASASAKSEAVTNKTEVESNAISSLNGEREDISGPREPLQKVQQPFAEGEIGAAEAPQEAEAVSQAQKGAERGAEEGFSPSSIWAEAGIAEEPHTEAVVSSPGLGLLKSMIFELQNPHSSGEITLMILRFASEVMNRAVLFIVRKNIIEGLGQFGITLKEGDTNRRIKSIRICADDESVFREALVRKVTIKKDRLEPIPVHEYFIKELGGQWPDEVFISPLLVNRKVAALLYGDNVPEKKPIGDTESLEIFLAQAGIAMEKALLERRLIIRGKE